MVLSWINRTLSLHIPQNTICFDSSFDLWEDLKERFTKGNHFRFSELLRELHSIQQCDRSLFTYFTDLKILWDELEELHPKPSCTCITPWTCDLAKVLRNFKHMEYVTWFLKGLDDNNHNIRTQILLLDHLPSISRVYSLVFQQHIPPTTIPKYNPTILYANQNNNPRNKGKTNPKTSLLCTRCNKTNHTVDNCYFKHRFSPGYRNKNWNNASDSKNYSTHDKDNVVNKEDYQVWQACNSWYWCNLRYDQHM